MEIENTVTVEHISSPKKAMSLMGFDHRTS
jgi:hypothetical protein